MKIFTHLKSNWLRYGFETIAVVVGILVAFQLDNWNEDRKLKDLEQDLLIQFQSDLQSDIEAIKVINLLYEETIFSCEVLTYHLKNRIPFHDSLKIHFDLWNNYESLSFRSGAISNLNSRGVELIANVNLRNQILELYNQHQTFNLKSNEFFREDHVHLTYKVHLERIEPILWRESAMPNDYYSLFEDQVFINYIQWIKNAALFNKLANEDLIQEINAVLSQIELESRKP